VTAIELAAYGCGPDEAAPFAELGPRFGVATRTTADPVSAANASWATGCRSVSVEHRTRLTRAELRALRDAGVEHVSTRSIGVDHIDLGAAAELEIDVEGVPYSPDGVADFTLMLILMAVREASEIVAGVQRHDFRLRPARGRDLRDLTVGVVGFGRIGAAVVARLHGFGSRVLATDSGRAATWPTEHVSLPELLRRSDVVTLHVPLTADTHHLIGTAQLAAMPPGAILVNTSRGPLVDTAALVAALDRGHLGGAALDVLEGEDGIFSSDLSRQPIEHRALLQLQALPNVVVTPHTAFHTQRQLQETVEATLRQCRRRERRSAGAAQGRRPVRR
jgi:D-specific alpha-keto acid dehydrogenase